jgi:hypothetical protein
VADFDSTPEPIANDPTTKLIFNMTVSLRDSRPKAAGAPSKSRKEEQAKQLAEKQVLFVFWSSILSQCVISTIYECRR